MTGRRREPVAGGRPHRIVLRLSDAEHALLQSRADAAEVTVQRLVVDAASGDPSSLRRLMAGELMGCRRLLTNATGNVNQIARALNSGVPVSRDVVERNLDQLAAAVTRLDAHLDRRRSS